MTKRVLIFSPRAGSQVIGMFPHRLARALRRQGCSVVVVPAVDGAPPQRAAPREAAAPRRRRPPRRGATSPT
jgi:hypothetical protein